MMDPSQTVLSWRKCIDSVKFPKDSLEVIDLVCEWKQCDFLIWGHILGSMILVTLAGDCASSASVS